MTELLYLSDPRLEMPAALRGRLEALDILTVQQTLELARSRPGLQKAGVGKLPPALVERMTALTGPWPRPSGVGRRPPPINGVIPPQEGAPDIGPVASDSARDRRRRVRARLDSLGEPMPRLALEPWFPEVYDQSQAGSCCGQALAGARGFHIGRPLSGEFSYRTGQLFDPFPEGTEGSTVTAALEGCFHHGAVAPDLYGYDDLIENRPVAPLFDRAAPLRSRGYASLLAGLEDYADLPRLILAVLAGELIDGIGPRGVLVSTAVYDSMLGDVAYETGLMSMPLPGETPAGAHAWVITGSVMAPHPDAPGGRPFFTVRNSWSRGWAAHNPLGLRGHALIPHRFFASRERVYETAFLLAEATPEEVGPVPD